MRFQLGSTPWSAPKISSAGLTNGAEHGLRRIEQPKIALRREFQDFNRLYAPRLARSAPT